MIGFSSGYLTKISLLGNSFNTTPADEAAPLASIIDSGISLGPERVPHTKTPGRDVQTGENSGLVTNPESFNSTPSFVARFLNCGVDFSPTERIINSNDSLLILPFSSYLSKRLSLVGSISTSDMRARTNRVLCSCLALSINLSKFFPYALTSIPKTAISTSDRCSVIIIASFAACIQQIAEQYSFPVFSSLDPTH